MDRSVRRQPVSGWRVLDPDYAHVLQAPLFGHIRVERFSEGAPWGVSWSVPGYCDRLLEGKFPDARSAQLAAEDHIRERLEATLSEMGRAPSEPETDAPEPQEGGR